MFGNTQMMSNANAFPTCLEHLILTNTPHRPFETKSIALTNLFEVYSSPTKKPKIIRSIYLEGF